MRLDCSRSAYATEFDETAKITLGPRRLKLLAMLSGKWPGLISLTILTARVTVPAAQREAGRS